MEKLDKELVNSIKVAIRYLHDDINGQALLAFLDEICGKNAPRYDPGNSTTVILAAGRLEVLSTIRNLEILSEEQIMQYYKI